MCTSGDYERFVEINGIRHSHIVDPRTGLPVRLLPSVTVVAADATTADAWATALSVLGADGFADLPSGVEALVVEGDDTDCTLRATGGMRSLVSVGAKHPCRWR